MKKYLIPFFISLFVILILLCGCFSEENESTEKQTLYVDDSGSQKYMRIQEAINAANTGDTVFVYNGTYYESIIIDKSINLIGENEKNTQIILDNDNIKFLDEKYSYIPNDEVGIVHITANYCTVQGFTIKNRVNTDQYNYDVSCVRISSSNNVISNNIILEGKYGVFLFEATYDNTVSYNNISLNDYCGIYISSRTERNNFYNNDISNNFYGIRAKGTSFNVIYKNNITGNLDGITFCCGAKNNTIFKNNFRNNTGLQAHDLIGDNNWDNENIGNFWDDYTVKYPNATYDEFIYNIPYDIPGGFVSDNYPLVKPYEENNSNHH